MVISSSGIFMLLIFMLNILVVLGYGIVVDMCIVM